MEVNPINDWKLKIARNTINIVIAGKVGHGKSSTGNSILGSDGFETELDRSRVTSSSDLQRYIRKDGRIVNVIDTPGFDSPTSFELISGELVKCIDLAKEGIHAVLMVFSLRSHFSIEEEAVIECMKSLFGDKIVDYMILVFTNGDMLESTHKSLKDFISLSPEPLRNIIQLCKSRVIIFDNITEDMIKREEQVNELLSLVDSVIVDNGGKPYLNKNFVELKAAEERATQLEAIVRAGQQEAERFSKVSLKDEEFQKLEEEFIENMRINKELKKTVEELKKKIEEQNKLNAKRKKCFFL